MMTFGHQLALGASSTACPVTAGSIQTHERNQACAAITAMSELPPPRTDHAGRPLPISFCPACGYTLDAASNPPGAGEERPKPGDLTVCFKCGQTILVFEPDMTLRLARSEDLDGLDVETLYQLRKLQIKIQDLPPRQH